MRIDRSVRARSAAASVLLSVLVLGGCAGDPDPGSSAPDGLSPLTFALDWAPNTNHVGVYVADALGYFEEEGIDLEILPYGSTSVAELVSAGSADFGMVGQASVLLGRTAGRDIVSVYSVTTRDTGRLVYLADRDDISRPADLDGLVFGGFGSPLYAAYVDTVIRGDGGEGDFDEVVLDTGAYEALSQGRIDFTLSVATWENLQAEIDGHPYAEFRYQDYGLPEQQSTGIVSSDAYLAAHEDEAEGFVAAVQRGYAYAAEHPDEAADILVAAEPDTLGTAEELVRRSTDLLASGGYLVPDEGAPGAADPQVWADFGRFLVEQGFLTDAAGEAVTDEPEWSAYYTNEYLP